MSRLIVYMDFIYSYGRAVTITPKHPVLSHYVLRICITYIIPVTTGLSIVNLCVSNATYTPDR